MMVSQYQGTITAPINYIQPDDSEFNIYLNDALKRYSEINNENFNTSKVYNFLTVLKDICDNLQLQPYIAFNRLAAKIQFVFNDNDFTLDYDYEEPDSVFVLAPINGTVVVKECILDKLEEMLRSF